MEYICLLCFHKWHERIDRAKERQCSHCRGRAAVEYQAFEQTVKRMRRIIHSSERPIISVLRAVEAMSPLTGRVRPGPLKVIRLWRKVLTEAGAKQADLNMYQKTIRNSQ